MASENENPNPLDEGIDLPPYQMKRFTIDVNGREEHESWLKDPQKCADHGIDIMYETIVYLKRWGGWLNDQ
jgi:hypothetical protein